MSVVFRVSHERGDYGETRWTVEHPAGACSGGGDAEAVIRRALETASLNGVDVSSVTLEYGHYARVWVPEESDDASRQTD